MQLEISGNNQKIPEPHKGKYEIKELYNTAILRTADVLRKVLM
jgi:hypothetical protein